MRNIFIFIIKAYQKFLSPLLCKYGKCRFTPSCSDYALEALKRFGVVNGVYKAITRILKCHPFHPGGYDPVLKENNKKKE